MIKEKESIFAKSVKKRDKNEAIFSEYKLLTLASQRSQEL